MNDRIDILLGTYNGAAHLEELLVSIERQTHRNWRLIARDDGSSDVTADILEAFAARYNREVVLLRDSGTNLGACANFAALMAASDAPYFAFSDQDDVWLPEKLATMLAAVQTEEAAHGAACPILAHSDLEVVDVAMQPVAPSFWEMLQYEPSRAGEKSEVLLENTVTGCATLGNAALRSKSLPIPADAVMHDWWIALVTTYLGHMVPVSVATIRYRQHGMNVIGAADWAPLAMVQRFLQSPGQSIARTIRIVRRTQSQAAAFLERFGDQLSEQDLEPLRNWAEASSKGRMRRKLDFMRDGPWASYWLRNLFYWIVL